MDVLIRFMLRIRLLFAWRGSAVGLVIGSLIGTALVLLDYYNSIRLDTPILVASCCVCSSAIVGAIAGYARRVPLPKVADSIDRRGALQNRVESSLLDGSDAMHTSQRSDAIAKLAQFKPNVLFPVRVSRLHGAALCVAAVPLALCWLLHSSVLLSENEIGERNEMKDAAVVIERLPRLGIKEQKEGEKKAALEAKKLQQDLDRFRKDLEQGRMSKVGAMQKADQLSEKSKELSKLQAAEVEKNIQTASKMIEKIQMDKLHESGMDVDREDLRKALSMTKEEARRAKGANTEAQNKVKKDLQEAQSELTRVQSQLAGDQLSAEQREELSKHEKELQKKVADLQKQLEALREELEAIQKSQAIQEMIKALNEQPEMQRIREMLKKLHEANTSKDSGDVPAMSDEEIAAMKAELKKLKEDLEKLAEKLKDPEAMKEFLKALEEALMNTKESKGTGLIGISLDALFGMPLSSPAMDDDKMPMDTKQVKHNKNGEQGGGKATITQLSGKAQEIGKESYIEIKGPARIGKRSGVPYRELLPDYRRKAESAIKRNAIPKKHETRVKKYFESLGQ